MTIHRETNATRARVSLNIYKVNGTYTIFLFGKILRG